MKKPAAATATLFLTAAITAANPAPHPRASDTLAPAEFLSPPINTRPGSFWSWLNGSISSEQITRDLEEMKRGGMKGGEIWDVSAHADPDNRVPAGPEFLGPESTRLIAHAIREAERLGMEIGIVASSGWNAGGSWVTPEHAGKALYHSATPVAGPAKFKDKLPLPELPELTPRGDDGKPIFLREVAVLAIKSDSADGSDSPGTIASPEHMIDLTEKLTADGTLQWDAPKGQWTILRFICTNHGQLLHVPSPNSVGPMIDFFDPAATEFHLDHITSTILSELGRDTFEGTPFKTLEFDSMELAGFTPWTERMAGEFQRRAGYPIRSYLPLLAGWKLADKSTQEKFLYDWQKVVSDLLIDSHYATASAFLKKIGVSLIAESGGPGPPIWNSNPVEAITALGAADIPRGEFWIRHQGIFLVKAISSAAHVYNKRVVDAEAFTTWRRWVDGPLNHKDLADRALCEGLNNFSMHTFASSPPEAGLPGWAYHAGTDINPAATWWPMVRPFMDYLSRCSYMLRQGWFVADVCYYFGDQAPNFYPASCLVPEKPLLDGLHAGHDYDVCSSQVILERMTVENRRITLPCGMSYAALVLPPQNHIPLRVYEKIRELNAAGGTVIADPLPTRAPGLHENEAASEAIAAITAELKTGSHGEGRIMLTSDRSQALRDLGVAPAFGIVGREPGDLGPLQFVNRRTRDDTFYFIRNKSRESVALTGRFRVDARANGRTPEFWWPHDGGRTACPEWKSTDGGLTELPIQLGPLGSVFVVFRNDAAASLDPLAIDTFAPSESQVLDGPWKVEFPEGWGAPPRAEFPQLQSWTEFADEGIRLFSGIATYRKSFELPEAMLENERLVLELGDLAEIAEVSLNGEDLGITWLPPFRVEATGALRPGTNHLEIRVANLWANRFNGDSLLPEEKRFTRSNLDRIQTDPTSDSSFGQVPRGPGRPVYTKLPPLMKSGLIGPVRIITP